MEILTIIYLGYIFISLYFMSFFIIIYLRNRKDLFKSPKAIKHYSLSLLIPVYNAEDVIEKTINSVFNSKYELFEVIAINDGSVDKTEEKIKKLMKKYSKLKLISKKKSGKADSLNQGIKKAKGELIAVVDADSYPNPDAISKMVGFFNDEKVAAVTNAIMVKNKKKFLEILQAFEYSVIAWTRKLLDYVDCVYVTNGPLSIYRATALRQIGGFDPKNMTEDIEVTWHLISEGYTTKMCLNAKTYTIVPSTFKEWKKQRIRWNIGGLQTVFKYKSFFLRKNMLGYFILPFFVVSMILGIIGLSIFIYLFIRRFLVAYFSVSYSMYAQTAILTAQEINLNPSILIYFGIVLFLLGLFFTLFALKIMKEGQLKKENIFNLGFYLIVYLITFPVLMVISIFKLILGKFEW